MENQCRLWVNTKAEKRLGLVLFAIQATLKKNGAENIFTRLNRRCATENLTKL